MTEHVFRSIDTASAMDKVQRELGDDAYILSIRNVDGMVEIVATQDALVRARRAPGMRPRSSFARLLEAAGGKRDEGDEAADEGQSDAERTHAALAEVLARAKEMPGKPAPKGELKAAAEAKAETRTEAPAPAKAPAAPPAEAPMPPFVTERIRAAAAAAKAAAEAEKEARARPAEPKAPPENAKAQTPAPDDARLTEPEEPAEPAAKAPALLFRSQARAPAAAPFRVPLFPETGALLPARPEEPAIVAAPEEAAAPAAAPEPEAKPEPAPEPEAEAKSPAPAPAPAAAPPILPAPRVEPLASPAVPAEVLHEITPVTVPGAPPAPETPPATQAETPAPEPKPAPEPEPEPDTPPTQKQPLAALAAQLVANSPGAALHAAPLVAVIGPPGAGKTVLAAKLAAERRRHSGPQGRPRLASLRPAQLAEDGRLPALARMMGLTHLSIAQSAPELPAPPPGDAAPGLIIDVDTMPTAEAHAALEALAEAAGGMIVVLALPAPWGARGLAEQLALHAPLVPVVALTQMDIGAIGRPELEALAEGGAPLALLSGTDRLIGTIEAPDAALLLHYLQELA